MLLSKCSDIMMDKFIDCLCNQNYSALSDGKHTEAELLDNWHNVFYEYCDLINTSQYKQMLKSLKTIGVTEAKIYAISACLTVLAFKYDEECVKILKEYGYNYDFNFDNKETYLRDLQSVKSVSKGALMTLEIEKKNYEKMLEKTKKDMIKESDFDITFIALSKFMGYPVRKNQTTVSEYCSLVKTIKKNG